MTKSLRLMCLGSLVVMSLALTGCPPAVGPTADFVATPTEGTAPLTVEFSDASIVGDDAITRWEWNIGGITTVVGPNKTSHTFTNLGTYTVTLTVFANELSDSETKVAYITVHDSGEGEGG
jgi:PKD repeat protein